jgi:hypothetical protein
MKKSISLLLVASFLTPSLPLCADERKGVDLIIHKTDGQQIRGELIAVKQSALLLLERDSGTDITVDTGEIRVITHIKKSKVWKGMGLGLLIGGGAGAGVSSLAQEWGLTTSGTIVTLSAILVAAIGLAIGGYLGAVSGKAKTIQIEGKSNPEIHLILNKLRKKARIRNYE